MDAPVPWPPAQRAAATVTFTTHRTAPMAVEANDARAEGDAAQLHRAAPDAVVEAMVADKRAAPPPAAAAVCDSLPPYAVAVDVPPAECVVCLDLLAPFAGEAEAPPECIAALCAASADPPLRSALPALPCGHGCCAPCLDAYLRQAVPRAVRAAAAPAGFRVLCPGMLVPDAPARGAAGTSAWDMRCHTALPTALLTPYFPDSSFDPAAVAPAAADAGATPPRRAPSGVRQLLDDGRSELYVRLNTRPCAWCAAPSMRVAGCDFITCAACNRSWCWACGSRTPRTCPCAMEHEGGPLVEVIAWARFAPTRLHAAGRVLAVALLAPAAPLIYFFALCVIFPYELERALEAQRAVLSACRRALVVVAIFPLLAVLAALVTPALLAHDLYTGLTMRHHE